MTLRTTATQARLPNRIPAEAGLPSHGAFLAQRRFASLNGLRCLAIVDVIWYHASGREAGVLGRGLGVDLSFAISGFLITTLLAREYTKTGSIDLRRFYARRTLRIFPLYFAVLGLYVLLVACTRSGTPNGAAFFHHIPAYATYTSNWFVPLAQGASEIFYFAWSLATQEQFYLLWPLALVLCLTPGRWWRAGAVILSLIVIREVAQEVITGDNLLLTIARSIAAPICLGAGWALVFHSPTGFRAARRLVGHRAISAAVFAALTLGIALALPVGLLEFLLAALVAACCIREDNRIASFLTLRPLRFIGEISYGMYLLHMLGINCARPLVGARYGVPVFVVGTGATTAMAYVSYRWFERPILRYRDRMRQPDGHTRTPTAVTGSVPAVSARARS